VLTSRTALAVRTRPPIGAIVAVCAVLGVLACTSRLAAFHDSDSLLPTLVSIQYWTPYYWGQARWGMLLPALVGWITDPIANLLVQTAVMGCAGAAVFPLLAHRLRPRRAAPVVAMLALALFVATTADYLLFCWFLAQPFAIGLALVLLALHRLARPGLRNLFLGIGVLAVAAWVTLATLVVALGLLVGGAAGRGRDARRAPLHFALVAGLALGVAWLAPRVATPLPGETHLLSPGEWLGTLRGAIPRALQRDFGGPMPAGAALAGMSVVAILGLVPRRGRRAYATRWLVPLAGGVGAYGLLLVASSWAQQAPGPYIQRYMLPCNALGAVAAAAALVHLATPLARRRRTRRRLALVAVPAVLALAWVARIGPPGFAAGEAALAARAPLGEDAVAVDGPLFVAGDYWRVWRGVFFAQAFRLRHGIHQPVYGVTFRASAAAPLWTGTTPQDVWTVQLDDDPEYAPSVARYLGAAGCVREERRGHARLCLVHSPARRAPEP
jgi:hypothetical protein